MKLSELSGAHIGSRVTIATKDATVTGTLYAVHAEAEQIYSVGMCGSSETHIGRISVSVKVGKFETANLDGLTTCEVHGK